MGSKHKGSEQRVKGAEQGQQQAGGQNRDAQRQHEGGAHDRGAQQQRQHGQEAAKQRADEHNR